MKTTYIIKIRRASIEKELQKDFSEWLNSEVAKIVRIKQNAEDYPENYSINFKVIGNHEGTFSLEIIKNEKSKNKIQVIPGEKK